MAGFADGYTRGEVHALVGPVIGVKPESLQFVIIVSVTDDGLLRIQGPHQTPQVFGELMVQLMNQGWEENE
jgi:hypothetical protein